MEYANTLKMGRRDVLGNDFLIVVILEVLHLAVFYINRFDDLIKSDLVLTAVRFP